jgi:hypothetical protein
MPFSLKVYNLPMNGYRFYHPIEVRYGDLDPQGHLNNAKYLTFMEQTRVKYFLKLGLWDGQLFHAYRHHPGKCSGLFQSAYTLYP